MALGALVLIGAGIGPVSGVGVTARAASAGGVRGGDVASGGAPAVRVLEVFTTSPVLVRVGERVRLPVDVVCATEAGTACPATVELSLPSETGLATGLAAPFSAGLGFDLTAPLGRAVGRAASGVLAVQLRATAAGRTAYLTQTGSPPPPITIHATRDLPVAVLPRIALGATEPWREVLFLPWGTGPGRVGLRPGNESPTVGPTSFDVRPDGTIVLLDSVQSRLAEFADGRLVREVPLSEGALGDIAVVPSGEVYLAARTPGASWETTVFRVQADRAPVETVARLPGLATEIRRTPGGVSVRLLPLDAWVPVDGSGIRLASTGRPGASGALLVSVTQDRVRLGTSAGGRVVGAVELRSADPMGAIALAEPDGEGGYWAVLHVTTDHPTPGNQYQVVHVLEDRSVRTFAVDAADYAEVGTRSRFRLGPDGALYQLRTAPDGVRIARFELGRWS